MNMNWSISSALAIIAIILVVVTYLTPAPLLPIAVILLGLAIVFAGK